VTRGLMKFRGVFRLSLLSWWGGGGNMASDSNGRWGVFTTSRIYTFEWRFTAIFNNKRAHKPVNAGLVFTFTHVIVNWPFIAY